jgi:hypothetical protein
MGKKFNSYRFSFLIKDTDLTPKSFYDLNLNAKSEPLLK